MDFYNCPYVVVIPFRNRNEYDEDYRCAATKKSCQCCQCKLTAEECDQLIKKHENCSLKGEKGMLFKNGEGYPDPTAAGAIREADKVPDHIGWYIKTVKQIASLIGIEVIGRIQIKDKKTGREYR